MSTTPVFSGMMLPWNRYSKRIYRPEIGCKTLSVFVSIYTLVFLNFTFWHKGMEYYSGHIVDFVILGVGIFLLLNAVILSFSVKYCIKPIFILFILISAVSSYYQDTFGILITNEMIRDAVTTTVNEARHLITGKFVFHVFVFGIVPSFLVGWIKVKHQTILTKVATNTAYILACVVVILGTVTVNYPLNASVFRNHHDFIGSLNPVGPIASAIKYTRIILSERNIVVAPLGLDAEKGPLATAAPNPVITILVVGETARAQNFSLNIYDRETNPELARRNVISFTDVTSCGTATAVSMPCMFSLDGRSEHSSSRGLSNENLLDVLVHAGVNVVWWDNNTGDKGVAARIPSENLSRGDTVPFCRDGECDDGILVDRLNRYIGDLTEDTVIVMHQIGSHGPSYYLRYPPEFEKFTPACSTDQLGDCTQAEIINAYDNTILYTDHVLAQIIDLLEAQEDNFVTSMIYMSDHGESLGEFGLYLHGAPYLIAPEVQTRVPFIMWLSPEFASTMHIDSSCLRSRRELEVSHDNLFHSVLGGMNIHTEIYQRDLDIFALCQS